MFKKSTVITAAWLTVLLIVVAAVAWRGLGLSFKGAETQETLTSPEGLCESLDLEGLEAVLPAASGTWGNAEEYLSDSNENRDRVACWAQSSGDDGENRLEIVVRYNGEHFSWSPTDARFISEEDGYTYATSIDPNGNLQSIGYLEHLNVDVQITCSCSIDIDSDTYDEQLSQGMLKVAEQVIELSEQ
ncbi:hypothetical protein [Glycomyces sp. MUSA5-2]|uniref:hypothetical protein n=1 Tax=Glycomyces sp. MUSA5-2 TaxID=2053002 RepID=UPI00300B95C5